MEASAKRHRQEVIPDPLPFEWKEDTPFIARCYPPGRHPGWEPKTIAPYIDEALAYGIKTIYMPNLSRASLQIAHTRTLTTTTVVRGITVRTNRKQPVGGLYPIGPGEGCGLLIGGCSVIVITVAKVNARTGHRKNFLIVLHGMRDMLIDRLAVLAEPSQRRMLPRRSIIFEAEKLLARMNIVPKDCSLVSLFSISPGDFIHAPDHELYGDYNRNLPDYVSTELKEPNAVLNHASGTSLSMPAIISADARRCGFKKVGAYRNLPPCGTDPRGFVHTRLDTERKHLRNLALIYCPA